jgi:pimeloyl-ACP methyl ester carboxylesterase
VAQKILTCLPANWNGQLVVYAHGYVAPQERLALPADEINRVTLPDGSTFVDVLLSQGFAFATSSYRKNGYAVEQAGEDLNALVEYFNTGVAPVPAQKVFVVGASEGGLITTMLVEKHPDIYDGGLAMCGPIGGMPAQLQYLGDFRVVFDYFFPQVFPFGAADVPSKAYKDWERVYVPSIAGAIQSDPVATTQLFSVTGAADDLGDPTSYGLTALGVLYYSVWGTNDLIATAGGMPYDNQDTWYAGSSDDEALNNGVERVIGDLVAQGYIGSYYQPTGTLGRPLVTLHNTLDPVVPYWHEGLYAGLEPGGLFVSIPVVGYGHCEFTAEEVLGAFNILVSPGP